MAVDLGMVGGRSGCGCGEAPEVDVALEGVESVNGNADEGERRGIYVVVCSSYQTTVSSNTYTANATAWLRDQLMRAFVFSKIPYPDAASSIGGYDLPLIRMYHDIVDGHVMDIVPLYSPASCIPYLHCAIFRRRDHPSTLTMECHARDISGMSLKGKERVRVRRSNIVELDVLVSCRRQPAFVR